MSDGVLSEEVRGQVSSLGEADILIGIPSYNNSRTIGHVVRAVQTGLAKYFPDMKCVLVNSDGGSTDGTMETVQETAVEDYQAILIRHETKPLLKITTPYHGIPGKGSAFRTIFEIASSLRVKACAVVDSDLRSITPEWVELLIKPIIDHGFDYVAPLYHRHKYDGTITNSIVYPLTRALYGQRVRQPIGGDFGFSGTLAGHYLTRDVWETDVARYGIDIWMTTTAIADGFKVCQSFLGAKIHDPKDPGADLSAMLYQVVAATFGLMEQYVPVWKSVHASQRVPVFGFQYAVGLEPVSVNVERMINTFRLGVRELSDIWKDTVPSEALGEFERAAALPAEDFHLSDEAWADTIYGFALAAHRRVINMEHLLKSLTPLYLGRTASFVIANRDSSSAEVEERIERLCTVFEERKDRLVQHWENTKED